MHELGIMQSALALVEEYARRENAAKVLRIVLRIGALSGVEPDALRFAFEVATADTIADGAALEIEPVAALVHCGPCDRDFVPETGGIFQCPRCGGLGGILKQGRELELARIEMI